MLHFFRCGIRFSVDAAATVLLHVEMFFWCIGGSRVTILVNNIDFCQWEACSKCFCVEKHQYGTTRQRANGWRGRCSKGGAPRVQLELVLKQHFLCEKGQLLSAGQEGEQRREEHPPLPSNSVPAIIQYGNLPCGLWPVAEVQLPVESWWNQQHW